MSNVGKGDSFSLAPKFLGLPESTVVQDFKCRPPRKGVIYIPTPSQKIVTPRRVGTGQAWFKTTSLSVKTDEGPKQYVDGAKNWVDVDGARTPIRQDETLKAEEALSYALEALYPRLQPSREDLLSCEKCLDTLNSQVLKGSGWEAVPFGSYTQGIFTRDSDLDVTVVTTSVGEDLKELKELPTSLQEQLRLCPAFSGGDLHPVGTVAPVVRLEFLRGRGRGFLEVDLTVNNRSPLENSRLLKRYTDFAPEVRHLCFAVKFWAKKMSVLGGRHGYLSSYAFVLMVVYFLQIECSLPVLDMEEDTSTMACLWHLENQSSIGSMLSRFFEFYTNKFQWGSEVVSVRLGTRRSRYDAAFAGLRCSQRPTMTGRIIIEDPILHERDLSATLRTELEADMKAKLREALQEAIAGKVAMWWEYPVVNPRKLEDGRFKMLKKTAETSIDMYTFCTWRCDEKFGSLEMDKLRERETRKRESGTRQRDVTVITGTNEVFFVLSDRAAERVVAQGTQGPHISWVELSTPRDHEYLSGILCVGVCADGPSGLETLLALENLLSTVRKRVVVLGYFEAQLARSMKQTIGKFCIYDRFDEAGLRLYNMMTRFELMAASTMFQPSGKGRKKSNSGNANYSNGNGRLSQPQQILVSCAAKQSCLNCYTKWLGNSPKEKEHVPGYALVQMEWNLAGTYCGVHYTNGERKRLSAKGSRKINS